VFITRPVPYVEEFLATLPALLSGGKPVVAHLLLFNSQPHCIALVDHFLVDHGSAFASVQRLGLEAGGGGGEEGAGDERSARQAAM
jgi:hypothetical protein